MVDAEFVLQLYKRLLDGTLTRDEADAHSYKCLLSDEDADIAGDAVCERIVEELEFLHGINIQAENREYLNSDMEISERYNMFAEFLRKVGRLPANGTNANLDLT